jgi:hypothetical protein
VMVMLIVGYVVCWLCLLLWIYLKINAVTSQSHPLFLGKIPALFLDKIPHV